MWGGPASATDTSIFLSGRGENATDHVWGDTLWHPPRELRLEGGSLHSHANNYEDNMNTI